MHKQVLCYKMTIYNAFFKVDRIAMILSNVWNITKHVNGYYQRPEMLKTQNTSDSNTVFCSREVNFNYKRRWETISQQTSYQWTNIWSCSNSLILSQQQ